MHLFKRDYWWVWLLFFIFGNGIGTFILAAFLDLYDKNAWYTKWQNWVLGLLFFVFPAFIMLQVFMIQILVAVAAKLEVDGKEYYASPYVWILLCIIPIFGWILLAVLPTYLNIMILVKLYEGKAEQYIK